MQTEKTTNPRYHYLFTWICFLTLLIGAVYWYNRNPKPVEKPVFDISYTNEYIYLTWPGPKERPQLHSLKDYSGSFGPNQEHSFTVSPCMTADGIVMIKRETTMQGKTTTIDYLALRPLYVEDAKNLHLLAKASGKAYFGEDSTYDNYGHDLEKATVALSGLIRFAPLVHGVWHSTDGNKFKFIGYIGVKPTTRKGPYKDYLEGFYVVGNPKVTKVAGAATLAMHFFIKEVFGKQNPPGMILSVRKDNKRSHRVAEKLHFTKRGLEANAISYEGGTYRKDIITYTLENPERKTKA